MSQECGKCKFYDGVVDTGTCVVEPPKLIEGKTGHTPEHYYQPMVYANGRCGKFEQPMTAVERYVRDKELRELFAFKLELSPESEVVVGSSKDGQTKPPVVLQPKPESRKTTKKPRGRNRGK